jgi:uncharacterized surface protein with fasciclin (FAS1) repeats
MAMKRLFLKAAVAATTVALVSACGGSDDDHPTPETLAQVATSNGFTALVAAAVKAGLDDDLAAAAANLTVFAPTNAAFNNLATTLGFADATAMVTALPAPALASILSYHVLPARRTAAEITAGGATQATIYSFGGAATTLGVNTSNGVRLTDAVLTQASVTTANVPASNGIIHVIDKVLVPPGVLNIVQMARLNPSFSTLVGAVGTAGLATTLSGTGPFTVFAPTNDAFAAIQSTVAGLTTAQLSTVLTYHALGSQVLSNAIPFNTPIATLASQNITIAAGPAPTIATITDTTGGGSKIVAVDVRASNGVIHVIDRVLLPRLN